MQLSAWGSESEYLMGNPETTYFKIVHKKHTNFAMESIDIPLDGEASIRAHESRTLMCKLPRHADLLTHLYFVFDLPDIYSGYHIDDVDEQALQATCDAVTLAQQNGVAAKAALAVAKASMATAEDTFDEAQTDVTQATTALATATATAMQEHVTFTTSPYGQVPPPNIDPVISSQAALNAAQQQATVAQTALDTASTAVDAADVASTQATAASLAAETTNTDVTDAVHTNHRNRGYRFQWVRDIGTNLIQRADIIIGGSLIESIHGEWIAIWHELFMHDIDKDVYNNMVGNIPDLYDPAEVHGYGSTHVYPTSTLNPLYSVDPETPTGSVPSNTVLSNPYLRPPSIRGRRVRVPLCFWFSKNMGLALPLIALQYHDVEIRLELRPLNQLYTLQDPLVGDTFGERIVPSLPSHYIRNFMAHQTPDKFTAGDDLTTPTTPSTEGQNELIIHPHLMGNFVFMGESERNRFAQETHEYLIESVSRHSTEGVCGAMTIELDLKHPVKAMVWCAQRDDFVERNLLSNYTNWDSIDNSHHSLPHLVRAHGETFRLSTDAAHPDRMHTVTSLNTSHMLDAIQNLPTKFNFEKFDQEILQHVTIQFNGIKRFDTRDAVYYSSLQHYQHTVARRMPGVGMYSFAVHPSKYQPSGSCNMSRIRRVQFVVETTPVDVVDNENPTLRHQCKYTVYVYIMHYNLLRIFGGMGGLGFHL